MVRNAAWLKVRVDDGMFSDELAVSYPPTGNKYTMSIFVPREHVRMESKHQGDVRVNVIEEAGANWAILPTPYRDIVEVNAADLRER